MKHREPLIIFWLHEQGWNAVEIEVAVGITFRSMG